MREKLQKWTETGKQWYETGKQRLREYWFDLLLATINTWLVLNITFYWWKKIGVEGWSSVFFLRENPLLSVLLLILALTIYLSYKHHWFKKWLTWFKKLSRLAQNAIFLSGAFYVGLLIVILLTRLMDYDFQNEQSLLLIASVPLLVLVVLLLIERATSVKAKFAGIEVEFRRTITTTFNQTVTLPVEEGRVTKGYASELRRTIEEVRALPEPPRIFLVPITRRCDEIRVDFFVLRDYVYALSRMAPTIQYIVFVDEENKFLGFMTTQQFMAKYPKFELEVLLESLRELGERGYEDFGIFLRSTPEEALRRLRRELVLPLWDPRRESQKITLHDLPSLGAKNLYLQNPTVIEAYQKMVEHKIPGIPIVDERGKFQGIVTKDKVIQEVILQLLAKNTDK